MHVTIIGCGYVGLTTSVALAYIGHRVHCIDRNEAVVKSLQMGMVHIHEVGVQELLNDLGNCLTFGTWETFDPNTDIVIIAVGTPQKENGEANTLFVEEAAREVAQGLKPHRTYIVVVKSTVPIGTSRRVAQVIQRVMIERGTSANVFQASNPEFLREGMALYDTLYPDRIVVGPEKEEAVETIRRLYRPILEQTFEAPVFLPRPEGYGLPPLVTTDPTSAEMIKYAANAFLAVKISFINEIAGLCDKVGADVTEVARGIGLDPRIGPRFLSAGLGWGGSCFPKDTAALVAVASEYNYSLPIVQAAREVNTRQRLLIVEKLQSVLKVLRGRTIGVLGLAFKPNTDDVRESPAVELVRLLLERGAHVRAHDPVAVPGARQALSSLEIDFVENPYEAADGADALILATEWEEYRSINLQELACRMCTPVLVDARNVFKPDEARLAGLTYLGVGR